jgi:glycosyltransferase involved in cell wall biosynthesis
VRRLYPRLHGFWFLLHALKPGRVRHWVVVLVKEFKLNGLRGVLKRAKGALSSPYALLSYSFDKLYEAKSPIPIRMLTRFGPEPGKTSIVIPLPQGWNSAVGKKIESVRKSFGKGEEIIIVASGSDRSSPAVTEKISRTRGFKVFHFPGDSSMHRLLQKGAKESRGEHICFVDPEHVGPRQVGLKDFRELGRVVENDSTFRDGLPQKIAYVVPRLGISGGVYVVLQHCNLLRRLGHDAFVITLNPCSREECWPEIEVPVVEAGTFDEYLLENIDILIATHWTTVLYMTLLPSRRKIYFVQSDERRYSPKNEREVRTIEATYRTPCEYMTEAIWIQKWLTEEFGHEAYYVPNGIDLNLFCRVEPLVPKGNLPRVLIEGGIDFWFKGMEDAYNAVRDLDVEIWIVSSQGKPRRHWRYDRFFQDVPIQEMKKVYSSCDALLKMSKMEGFFGPPMEAMACGCPVVVSRVTGCDEYVEDGKNALVVGMGDVDEARSAVSRLIADGVLRERLVQGGYETVKNWSWERSIAQLEKAINKQAPEIFYTDHFPKPYSFEAWKLSLAA